MGQRVFSFYLLFVFFFFFYRPPSFTRVEFCEDSFCPGRASMPGVVVWDAARDERLRAAVRLHGRRWGLVAAAVGGGCSNRAARDRWGRGRVLSYGARSLEGETSASSSRSFLWIW